MKETCNTKFNNWSKQQLYIVNIDKLLFNNQELQLEIFFSGEYHIMSPTIQKHGSKFWKLKSFQTAALKLFAQHKSQQAQKCQER